MTEAQKCLYHIAENMRMDKSISKEGYEYFQQAIKALEQEPKILNTLDFAIDASNGGGNYFVGFRNGLRYAKSLIDGEEEPQFESCTEQEPCNDAISRQAAIDCLNADFTIDGKENMETVVDHINGAFKQIKALLRYKDGSRRMKQYGSYSDADLTDWERLPLPSKVLTQSAFGAWLMRRDEHRDKAMNLIPKSILEDIRAEIEQVSFTHYFEYGEYYGEDTREERIVNLDAVMKIIDKYRESEG